IVFKINVEQSVVLSSGPLSYQYTISNLTLHFGRENNRGSEHTISGVQFPGELQLYAYNSQLYSNWTEAKHEANGLAAISVLISFSKNSNQANTQLKHITHALKNITHRGPDFWGRLNPKWSHCNKGRRQSPIDINPELLLYDPGLLPVNINGDHVSGKLINTGRSIVFKINVEQSVVLSSGPLSYQYTISNLTLHFGRENNRGSEHTISGVQFPGELQLYAYNSQLYSNWTEAKHEANGLAAISVLISFSKNSNQANTQLKHITHALKNITHR
ncbi:unnamed protein product, partial [Medioppia subpectinata]